MLLGIRRTKAEIMRDIPHVKAKVIGNNTVMYNRANGDKVYRYHLTDIVTISEAGNIMLDSGGWRTSTTKGRMNEYSKLRLHQDRGQWWIEGHYYYDGITFNKDHKLISPEQKPDVDRIKKIKKGIAALCKMISKDNLPVPSSGDCWYCGMITEDKQALGDKVNNYDHLYSHIDEKYLHGSLLVNAMREKGYNDKQISFHYGLKVVDTFKRALRRYLQKRLLPDIARLET